MHGLGEIGGIYVHSTVFDIFFKNTIAAAKYFWKRSL